MLLQLCMYINIVVNITPSECTHLIVVSTDDIVDLYKLLDADEVKFSSRRLNRCHDLQMCRGSNCFIYGREKNGKRK